MVLVAVPSEGLNGTAPTTSTRTGAHPGDDSSELKPAFQVTVANNQSYNWPELHGTPTLAGYASNSTLSTLNASQLGVGWATNLYGSALDSPVTAFDPILNATLAYVGTESGNVLGINVSDGQIVWGVWLGSPIRSSPLVYNGSVYVGTFENPTIFRLNATTGSTEASYVSPRPLEATPVLATPPGGVPTLFIGTVDTGPGPGPFLALNALNLSLEWEFTDYNQTAGSWDSASYIVNASGVPMVIFGTDNPDSSVYDLNASSGQLIWRFQTDNPDDGDWDVASGITISPPGDNGFAQGVAYAVNKIGHAYALDLNNGTLIWENIFDGKGNYPSGVARSTPALDGTNLVLGYEFGLLDINATTGVRIWSYEDPTHTESIASPAIAGPSGQEVAVTGDVGGTLDVVSLAHGTVLYTYHTNGYFTASPAISGGNILIASSNGFLYDFAVGGGNEAVFPTTSIASPVQGATLNAPTGTVTITGNATDPTEVLAVEVAIQTGGVGGPWWDAATQTWSPGPVNDLATLATPGSNATNWSLIVSVPKAGGAFQVFANALSSTGVADPVGSEISYVVSYLTSGAHLEASSSYVSPGAAVTLKGGGFGRSTKVTVSLHGVFLATVTSKASGSLPSIRVVIPANSSFGLTALTAVAPSATLNIPITVANNWEQQGDGPGHLGFEKNDPTLNYLIFPGGNKWVKLAWHFDPGVPLNASPAIVDGVAYVADTQGQLFAIDTHNGGLDWTFTLASGAAIEGSPAVDPTLGLVFLGANDGTVDAVSVATGALVWSTSVGGDVAAPVFNSGELYVASSSGQIEALAEATGVATWAVGLGSNITSAPALDTSTSRLIVGESDGNVTEINAKTGVVGWNFTTGGPIAASAIVSAGKVYVGSEDTNVYCLVESSGALVWSFKTGAAIQDTGSLTNNGTDGGGLALFIGSNNGILYSLRASSGKQLFNVSVGPGGIVGVATARGIAIFETATGQITATRAYVKQDNWQFQTGAGLVSSPVVIDGTIYVDAEDGNLYAFTPTGQAPV
jgi:outer membrane protein assembly factor BamB